MLAGKKRYEVNELSLLARGDILMLFTDGLVEHDGGRFFPEAVERLLQGCGDCTADEICKRLDTAVRERCEPDDDISVVVIRRTQ